MNTLVDVSLSHWGGEQQHQQHEYSSLTLATVSASESLDDDVTSTLFLYLLLPDGVRLLDAAAAVDLGALAVDPEPLDVDGAVACDL